MQKKKVLVMGHDQKFWYPLQHNLEKTEKFIFKEDLWQGHDGHDEQKTLELMAWADIIVAEWALGNAIFAAKHKKKHQLLIVRLHSQERNTTHLNHIDFDNVDKFIFVAQHLVEICTNKFDIPSEIITVIPNFIDLDKYNLKKMGGCEFNLGMIGMAPQSKRLDLAVDTFELLYKKDKRYTLHIKGKQPYEYDWLWARTKEREYYTKVYERINQSEIRNNIIFDPPGANVQYWLQMMGFVLSPSDFESFHMAIAEGMAASTIPVIWNWPGAQQLYRNMPLMTDAYSAAEFIDFTRRSDSLEILQHQVKEYVYDVYHPQKIVDDWLEVLSAVPQQVHLSNAQYHSNQPPKLLVVWAMGTWIDLFRKEIFEALKAKYKDQVKILIIKNGYHSSTLVKNKLCTLDEIKKYSKLEYDEIKEGIYSLNIPFGGWIPDVTVHPLLKNSESYPDAVKASISYLFPEYEVLNWISKPNQMDYLVAGSPFIYDIYTDNASNEQLKEKEQQVFSKAQHIFFNTDQLFQRQKYSLNANSSILTSYRDIARLMKLTNISQRNDNEVVIDQKIDKKVLVVWAIERWSTFHRSEMIKALAENLKESFNILFVEPGNHYNTLLKNKIYSDVELEDFLSLKPATISNNLYRLCIINSGFLQSQPQGILGGIADYDQASKHAIQYIFGTNTEVLHWIYKPQQRTRVGSDRFIYEVYDEYTMHFKTGIVDEAVAHLEPSILQQADHVFFTSDILSERKKQFCKSSSIVGNGVFYDIFEKYRMPILQSFGRKTIGYLGNLSDFFNWQLMYEVCRQNSEIDFYFHGQVEKQRIGENQEMEALLGLSNTYFSGRVTREIGAAAINRYDILIIPFVINDAMDAVNPLKLWEYFATGKPVISTPMAALNHVPSPLLRVASNTDEWQKSIYECLHESPNLQIERINIAKENSWSELTKCHAVTLRKI